MLESNDGNKRSGIVDEKTLASQTSKKKKKILRISNNIIKK